MKKSKLFKFFGICFCVMQIFIFATSCEKETVTVTPGGGEENHGSNIPATTLLANQFVYEYTTDGYLWNKYIPSNINYKNETDTKAMFDKMVYRDYDRWSYVSDDAKSELDGFAGVYTTFGYALWVVRFSNEGDGLFAVVKYVVDNSPAKEAGLKRGDIILTIDDENITTENYLNLFYSSNIKLGLGKISNNEIGLNGVTVNLVAKEMYEDPVLHYSVIDKGAKKIGYLAYAGFYKESHDKLVKIFTDFKSKGVNELVLDFRYNPGGNAVTPPFLGSLIAPEKNVRNKDIFLKEIWNDGYMNYFKGKNEDLNDYFNSDIPVNLNLNRIFVLTTDGTASASEATICGLMPYMDVIKIGTTTHGKYCGAGLFQPKDNNGKLVQGIDNWLLSLVIYKFANANDYTDFKDGIAPDYEIEDNFVENIYPFGDVKDAHLSKAISIIMGTKSTWTQNKSNSMDKYKQISIPDKIQNRGGHVKLMD